MADGIFQISAKLPPEVVKDFVNAYTRYKTELGNAQPDAIRRGVVALIQSLRARTPAAKKRIPRKSVQKYDGPGPHYITERGGEKAYHRWTVRRWDKGKRVTKIYAADTGTEVWQRFGYVYRHKLAKKSWGKFMQLLFKRSEPAGGNPNAKVTDRMVHGYMNEFVTGDNPRVEVLMVNELDYITRQTTPEMVEEAMHAATTRINHQIDRIIRRRTKS